MFKKVWQGSVQLLQLVGPERPLGEKVLSTLDLLQIARRGLPFPANTLWDIAAAVDVKEQRDGAEHKASTLPTFEVRMCKHTWPGTSCAWMAPIWD